MLLRCTLQLLVSAAVLQLRVCVGHGSMCMPPSWQDRDGALKCRGNLGARPGHEMAGCTSTGAATGTPWSGTGGRADGQIEPYKGCVSYYYTNNTFLPDGVNPTIPLGSPLLTYRYPDGVDWSERNPWRAPGSAHVWSPCGHDGGNPRGCPAGNPNNVTDGACSWRWPKCHKVAPLGGPTCGAGGYAHGPDARELPGNSNPLLWAAGSVVEVAWRNTANHGGGYSYRLCKKPKANGNLGVTEECFQRTPLRFVGDRQWLQMNNGTRFEIPAIRTSEGTVPTGSSWTRYPIPSCYNPSDPVDPTTCYSHANVDVPGKQPSLNFPPPVEGVFPVVGGSHGLFGYISSFARGYPGTTAGDNYFPNSTEFMPDFAIVDKVQLPAGLDPGDYVVSFRYDCEQTSQVWSTCGDVRIEA